MKKRKNFLVAAIVAVVLGVTAPMVVEARETEQYACSVGGCIGICRHFEGSIFGITLWDYWSFQKIGC